jgi:predicted HTH transcriptional regulator
MDENHEPPEVGGRVYLGIDDDCVVSGIDLKLAQWAKAAADKSVTDRYLGALKSRIKGLVHGEVRLHLSPVEIDGRLVAVVDVSPADPKPISIRQDSYLYARTGASNRRVPPEQWRSVLESTRQAGFY